MCQEQVSNSARHSEHPSVFSLAFASVSSRRRHYLSAPAYGGVGKRVGCNKRARLQPKEQNFLQADYLKERTARVR